MIGPRAFCLAAALPLLLCACTASHYKAAADKQVYAILEAKEAEVLGKSSAFNIDTEWSGRDPQEIAAEEVIAGRTSQEPRRLNLLEALGYAIDHNRAYQTRKENLYLTALALTAERYAFDPKLASNHEAGYEWLKEDERGSASNRLSVSQLFRSGATLGATIANDLLAYTTGDPRRSATTVLSVNLVQPLLRGYGADIVAENLTQAERNVVYEVRSFTRYQQTFWVDIATRYYRLLQQQDTVRNEYNNYLNLVRARERAEAMSADRLPEFQVDQTRQDELRARNRYILAVEEYKATLDDFKVLLGMPIGTPLSLDNAALTSLADAGITPVPVAEEAAIDLALVRRLDFLNNIDQYDDAKRQIVIAADDLDADLELFANAGLSSDSGTRWERFQADDMTGEVGVRLKLPLDKLRERNAYRRTFIDFERRLRDLSLATDQVRDDIRSAYRTIDRARQNYTIQRLSVDLAARRVESANLLMQAGRAETRDLLEAQDSFVQAQNALTRALVDYHVARLELLRDMGLLDLRPEGFAADLPETGLPEPAADADNRLIPPDELF